VASAFLTSREKEESVSFARFNVKLIERWGNENEEKDG